MARPRAIAFVQELIEKDAITGEFGGRLKRILVHSIADPVSLTPLGAVSKFNIEPEFLDHLFDLGRKAATLWLASTVDSLGVKSTIDIRARFL
jgi:NTE family protein